MSGAICRGPREEASARVRERSYRLAEAEDRSEHAGRTSLKKKDEVGSSGYDRRVKWETSKPSSVFRSHASVFSASKSLNPTSSQVSSPAVVLRFALRCVSPRASCTRNSAPAALPDQNHTIPWCVVLHPARKTNL
eukprot:682478-Rhodomonas_salina.1